LQRCFEKERNREKLTINRQIKTPLTTTHIKFASGTPYMRVVSCNFYQTTIRLLLICFTVPFLTISCRQTTNISPGQIESVDLIQVDHPYLSGKVDSLKLDAKLIADFLEDFADKREEICKFYSCYVIKIHLKDGQLISYRTNGQLFEKFRDENTTAIYFKLNKRINLATKYWGIQEDEFCKHKEN